MKTLYDYVCKLESVMMSDNSPAKKINQLRDIKAIAYKDKNLDGLAYNILCKLYTSYVLDCENMHNK